MEKVKILSLKMFTIICSLACVYMLSGCAKVQSPFQEEMETEKVPSVQTDIEADEITISKEKSQFIANEELSFSDSEAEVTSTENNIKEKTEDLSNTESPVGAEDVTSSEMSKVANEKDIMISEPVAESEDISTEAIAEEDITEEDITEEDITEEAQPPVYTYTEISDSQYAKQALNVRDLPSTLGNVIGSLRAEEKVQITGQCNETQWYRIAYNGMVGYCSNKYLVAEILAVTQSPQNVQESMPAQSSQNEVDRVINEINTYWNQDVEINWDDSTFSKSDKERIALCIAQNVARDIESYCSTDYEKANAAAAYVANLCNYTPYTSDDQDYRTPYGILVCKAYTCAGTTRAVGLILDQLGIAWEHANENQWTHQWNIITDMDGKGIGWADGMLGWADYGEY